MILFWSRFITILVTWPPLTGYLDYFPDLLWLSRQKVDSPSRAFSSTFTDWVMKNDINYNCNELLTQAPKDKESSTICAAVFQLWRNLQGSAINLPASLFISTRSSSSCSRVAPRPFSRITWTWSNSCCRCACRAYKRTYQPADVGSRKSWEFGWSDNRGFHSPSIDLWSTTLSATCHWHSGDVTITRVSRTEYLATDPRSSLLTCLSRLSCCQFEA